MYSTRYKRFKGEWVNFESWLSLNKKKTVPDLSWKEYIVLSKEYNDERKYGKN